MDDMGRLELKFKLTDEALDIIREQLANHEKRIRFLEDKLEA